MRLDHFSIRTARLEESERFYRTILGLRVGYRPPFNFPGSWLYAGEAAVVHLVAIDPADPAATSDYLGARDGAHGNGTGTIDHVAFVRVDLTQTRAHFDQHGVKYREREVPSLKLHQIFVEDPNGVTLELNFSSEPERR